MVVCVGVVITPENGNRRWFKCMQGVQLDGVSSGLGILVYLDVMILVCIVAERKEYGMLYRCS